MKYSKIGLFLLVFGLFGCGQKKPLEPLEPLGQAEEIQLLSPSISQAFSATYTDYDAGFGFGRKKVVFFYSHSCGTCTHWEEKIIANLDQLPASTLIGKADFDADKALALKYGVLTQSTAVFLDELGQRVKTEVDPSLESLTAFFSS